MRQFDERSPRGAAAGSYFSPLWITKTIGIHPATFDAGDVILVKTPRPDAVRQAVEALRPEPIGFCVRPCGVQSGLLLKPESEHATGVRL